MAAEDLTGPSVLYVQSSSSWFGIVAGEIPVRPGFPRNIGHDSGVATPEGAAARAHEEIAKNAMAVRMAERSRMERSLYIVPAPQLL